MTVAGTLAEQFRRDGAVVLPRALGATAMRLAERAYEWSIANPGPHAADYSAGSAKFYQDVGNPGAPRNYAALIAHPDFANVARRVWGKTDVWFMFEQVFVKEGGESRRTPWHQDSPYLAVEGSDLAVVWISFEHVPTADSLEFVRGSHRGPMYNGSAFDPADDTAPVFPGDALPLLPDIERDRAGWDIVSWAVGPGDVLVFHPAILHGGAPTHPGGRRRTLTLRLFGEDATYVKRPWTMQGVGADAHDIALPFVPGMHETFRTGQRFRHPALPPMNASSV